MKHLFHNLQKAAKERPKKKAYIFYKKYKPVESIDFSTLLERAQNIGSDLQKRFKPQEPICLLYSPGIRLIEMLYACLAARLIPIIIPPPLNNLYFHYFAKLCIKTNASAIIVEDELYPEIKKLRLATWLKYIPLIPTFFKKITGFDLSDLPVIKAPLLMHSSLTKSNREYIPPQFNENDLAFLQFSSGSTKDPKGVMVSHANVMSNMNIIAINLNVVGDSDVKAVSWVPPYHDMGLVGMIHFVPFLQSELHFFSPIDFISSPLDWIQLISDLKATHAMAPNFAFEICNRFAESHPSRLENISLNCVKTILNGSEPINISTFEKFNDLFGKRGLKPTATQPCYGLAESVLYTTGTTDSIPPEIIHLDKQALFNHKIRTHFTPSNETVSYISHGTPLENVVIVNPETLNPCLKDEIGEIWISGPSVAQGYWKSPEETGKTFITDKTGTRWLRTGDYGFYYNHQLYICGRIKDLIIVAGKNYHPSDIEHTVEKLDNLIRFNRIIAFPIESRGREYAAIAFEAKKKLNSDQFNALSEKIYDGIYNKHGLMTYKIYAIAKGEIPKTTTGKLRRGLLKKNIEQKITKILHEWTSISEEEKGEVNLNQKPNIQEIIIRNLNLLSGKKVELNDVWNKPFSELGIDSLTIMELFHRISSDIGKSVHIPPTEFIGINSLKELSNEIELRLNETKQPTAPKNSSELPTKNILDKCRLQGNFAEYHTPEHLGYFIYPKLEGKLSNHMLFKGKEKIIWSTNNYLGIADDPRLTQNVIDICKKFGPSYPMGSRLLSGENNYAIQFEKDLTDFMQKEDSMLCNYGYLGIMGITDSLVDGQDYVVVDQMSHACMIDAAKLATFHSLNFRTFKHNNFEDLEQVLKSIRKKSNEGILILCEGVYSMTGSLAPLKEYCELKEKYGATLLVDDSHGFGVLGSKGLGTGQALGVHDKIDLYYSTFAKSLTSIGAFVSGNRYVIEYERFNCRTTIFSRSLPLINIVTAQTAFDIMKNEPERRDRLFKIKNLLQNGLREAGFTLVSTDSAITSVLFPNESHESIMRLIYMLREEYDIFVSGVTYPVVPREMTLLRLTVTSMHTEEDVEKTIKAFKAVRASTRGGA